MYSIAVTGGIACGKSLFGHFLSELGAEVVDADDIVRSLHLPGGKGACAVRDEFGPEYIRSDGGTNREKLAGLIFSDEKARVRLEELIHPIVREELLSRRRNFSKDGIFVALIPLLFEKQWQADWDHTVCVSAPEKLRFARLIARGLTEAQAVGRISSQMPDSERRALADTVVMNDSDPASLERAARMFFESVKTDFHQQ